MPIRGEIIFRSSDGKGRRFCRTLLDRFPDHLHVESVDEVRGGLTSRRGLGQEPVTEFVISIAEHVVALAVFEAIKEFVTAAAEKDELTLLKIRPPEETEKSEATHDT